MANKGLGRGFDARGVGSILGSGSIRYNENKQGSAKSAVKKEEETKTPENKTVEKKDPEKKTAEKKIPEKKTPEKKTAEKKTAEQEIAEQEIAEKESAEKKTAEKKTAEKKDVSRETLTVPISLIEPKKDQPRKKFEEESLQELADSIRKLGVLEPIVLRKNGDFYEIIIGERRWRAARLAGLKEIPAVVRDFTDREAAEAAIVENIQREDLDAIEEARAYQSLISSYGLTQEEVAERVSKNRSTITNSLRLLQLPEEVQVMLISGDLSAGHARALLGIESKKKLLAAATLVTANKLSVRETEKLVKKLNAEGPKKEKKKSEKDIYLEDLAGRLSESLATKVSIKAGRKGHGKVEIEYYSADDLEKIIDRLK